MKKLYRSETDKMLGGVCGGLAEYLTADATLIRVLFIIATMAGASGVLIYIILWLVIPSESDVNLETKETMEKNAEEMADKAEEVVKKVAKEVKSDTKKSK